MCSHVLFNILSNRLNSLFNRGIDLYFVQCNTQDCIAAKSHHQPPLYPSSESIRKFEMASASRELQLQNRAARSLLILILTQRDNERHLY